MAFNWKKCIRFGFWKVAMWVTFINVVFLGIGLVVVYFVKNPYQPAPIRINIPQYFLQGLISIAFQIVLYFFSVNGYYFLLKNRKGWLSYFGHSLLYLLGVIAYFWANNMITKQSMPHTVSLSMKVFIYCISAFLQLGIAFVVGAVYRQLDERKTEQARQRTLEQQKAQLEKEMLQANYLFLKAQINPHFLHNTLNFLYSKSLPYSEELSEGILTLSEIMRYSLDKEEDGSGKVLLNREIEHLHNIIKIQQLRFGNSLQVEFRIEGSTEGLRILPFVLITLVENAFKHGDLKNPDHPIRLLLQIQDQQLQFTCINRKKSGPKELSTGIGLDNTRKRLELAYGQQYSLYIKDQKELYTVDLKISL